MRVGTAEAGKKGHPAREAATNTGFRKGIGRDNVILETALSPHILDRVEHRGHWVGPFPRKSNEHTLLKAAQRFLLCLRLCRKAGRPRFKPTSQVALSRMSRPHP